MTFCSFTEKLSVNVHFISCSHSLKSSRDQHPACHRHPARGHLAPASTCLHGHPYQEAPGPLLPAPCTPCGSPGDSTQVLTHKPLYSPLLNCIANLVGFWCPLLYTGCFRPILVLCFVSSGAPSFGGTSLSPGTPLHVIVLDLTLAGTAPWLPWSLPTQ